MTVTLTERFERDPAFNALVKTLHAHIEAGKFTPTEIREAAMLAQIMYEERQPTRPIVFTAEQVRKGKV